MLLRISLFWDVTLHHCVSDCWCFRRNIVRSVAKIKRSRNFWIFAMFWRNVVPSDSRARGPRIVLVPGDPWRQWKRREPLLSHATSFQKNETLKNPAIITAYWHEIWGSDGVDMKITGVWDVTPFNVLKIERRFGGTYSFRFPPKSCNLLLHVDLIFLVRRCRFRISTRKQRVAISLRYILIFPVPFRKLSDI
jgi:hypothetical protein